MLLQGKETILSNAQFNHFSILFTKAKKEVTPIIIPASVFACFPSHYQLDNSHLAHSR